MAAIYVTCCCWFRGQFHPPRLVLAVTDTIFTLSPWLLQMHADSSILGWWNAIGANNAAAATSLWYECIYFVVWHTKHMKNRHLDEFSWLSVVAS